MDTRIAIRPAEPGDYPFILALNEANVEVLSPMDDERIRLFAQWAEQFQIVEVDGRPAAFLISLREGLRDYWSENYRWFSNTYPCFLYVDRIVVDTAYRKYGLGRRLYQGVIEHARSTGVPVVAAEIDTEPVYNEASLKFHAAMGFREVGTQYIRDGKIKVSLQAVEC